MTTFTRTDTWAVLAVLLSRGSRMEPKRYWLRLTSVNGSWCRAALAVVVAAVIAGCGDDATVATGGTPGGRDRPYTVTTTVLESPEHGPQLCLGGVAESLPPQCGGPDIVGWDWESVAGEESELGPRGASTPSSERTTASSHTHRTAAARRPPECGSD